MLAQAGAPVFAPPLGAPLLLRIEQVRDEAGTKRAFVTERRIVFARIGEGYRAEVTPLATDANASDASAGMFEAAMGALAGQTLVFTLDAAGKIVSIERQAERWASVADAVGARLAAGRSQVAAERTAIAARLAAPLRALPADRQLVMLGSMLAPAIAADVAGGGVATDAPVKLPIEAIGGVAASIDARRTVAVEGDALRLRIEGKGTHPGGAAVTIGVNRRIDSRTGLLREGRERVEIDMPAGGGRSIRTTTTSLKAIG